MTTTGRHPRLDALADTIDEADQPRPRSRSSGGIRLPEESVIDPYIDAPPDDPRAPCNVDMRDRIAALEAAMPRDLASRLAAIESTAPTHAANALWLRRGVKALTAIGGVAGAALIYALALARHDGATAQRRSIREAERREIVDIVRRLDKSDEARGKQIDILLERLRYYPVHGPALEPAPQPPPREP